MKPKFEITDARVIGVLISRAADSLMKDTAVTRYFNSIQVAFDNKHSYYNKSVGKAVKKYDKKDNNETRPNGRKNSMSDRISTEIKTDQAQGNTFGNTQTHSGSASNYGSDKLVLQRAHPDHRITDAERDMVRQVARRFFQALAVGVSEDQIDENTITYNNENIYICFYIK